MNMTGDILFAVFFYGNEPVLGSLAIGARVNSF